MWSLVLELDGHEPQFIQSYRRLEDAKRDAEALAQSHRYTGGKVTISQPDSADQFQRYGRDRFHRQEPEKVAEGQDLTVLVPRITLSEEEYQAWRRR